MKKTFTTLFFFSIFIINSQELEKKVVDFEPKMRIAMLIPFNFGNNSLSKDYKNSIGFSSNISFVKVYNTSLVVGYDFSKNIVTNNLSIGNFNHLNTNSYYLQIEHEIKINEKTQLNPYLGYGALNLNYKVSTSKRIARANANEIRIGTICDYKLNKTFSGFAGLSFNKMITKLNATPENQDYYGKATKIELTLGFELN